MTCFHSRIPSIPIVLAALLAAAWLPPTARTQEPAPRRTLRVLIDEDSGRELNLYPIRAVVEAIAASDEDPTAVLDAASRRALAHALRDAIGKFVQPPFDEGEEVQALGLEHLAVVGRPAQHAWVTRFLERQKASTDEIVMIEMHVLRAKPADFAALRIGDEPSVLGPDDAEGLLRRIAARTAAPDSGLDVLEAPRLAALSMQRASMAALTQTSYVKDYTVHDIDGQKIVDPEIDVVQDGVELQGSHVVLDDGLLGLSWHIRISDLLRPIPKLEKDLGVGQPVTIQLPDVAVAEFDADVRLARGELGVFPGPELRGKRVIVVISARIVDDVIQAPKDSDHDGPALRLGR